MSKCLARIIRCAVKKAAILSGNRPTRQLSLRPVAIGASVDAKKPTKPSM